MEQPVAARTYLWTWAALLVLTAATFALSHIELGAASTALGLIIAVCKASLIALIFMGLSRSDFTMRFALVGAVMTLLLLVLVVTMDVTTRSPLARPLGSGYQSEKSTPSFPRNPPSSSSWRPGSELARRCVDPCVAALPQVDAREGHHLEHLAVLGLVQAAHLHTVVGNQVAPLGIAPIERSHPSV